uniref:NADH dehydrogenase subunit 5 n=1 Tax=Ptychadena robeensis TaxID=2829185 RepID=UPI00286BF232|nr:NADH dehydrogenase subunit 5 [Ptychadena robeensis]WKT12091.1 NADH dehydrogenase subunit 5 [Ptychadena robeensis]WKT12104.1 NADH dehydrogenase subunit 5 [Ptychadena robeensis]WKT12117.1 NADH dehydrogenase subunit 5 [Ptychadena robeensis]WKT12130.1 NADH dehydrogenase subunit 5 [Ptychadena robeensis]WKT12156.1 NADH dehydrogenase subunit 5 [Ptychadena robeensis]
MILIIITFPLLFTSSPNFMTTASKAVKHAFIVSLLPLCLTISETTTGFINKIPWFDIFLTSLDFVFKFDMFPTIFLPVALFVTWNIMEYSQWYMSHDPNQRKFIKYLLIFLLTMVILVTSGNLITLFLGWEGVGLMSFLLIGWYYARNDAIVAAIQAVLYNRVGDIGFLMAFCWLIVHSGTIGLDFALATAESSTLPLVGFILAAASKSAQFGLHPWLASAMEGPTPVSALLHSSTMVVAGIYLLIRIHSALELNSLALTICLCLGAISTVFAATAALTQNDIKKIIAYSTSSQLGLMMVSIGLNLPHLALFHICTHAFFKAMLFLCSGIIIHSLNDEQDIRKMGGLQYHLPITTTCMTIGSFALMGAPFLAGFYSKDTIIEAMNTSYVNLTALFLTLIAVAFTAVYSLRLMFFTTLQYPRHNALVNFNELSTPIFTTITRLGLGSIFAGWLILHFFIPNNEVTHTMPLYIKLTASLITLFSFILAYDLAKHHWTEKPKNKIFSKRFSTNFYPTVLHRSLATAILDFSWKLAAHILDLILFKTLMPESLKNLQLPPIHIVRLSQTGLIKLYLSALLVTLILTYPLIFM